MTDRYDNSGPSSPGPRPEISWWKEVTEARDRGEPAPESMTLPAGLAPAALAAALARFGLWLALAGRGRFSLGR